MLATAGDFLTAKAAFEAAVKLVGNTVVHSAARTATVAHVPRGR